MLSSSNYSFFSNLGCFRDFFRWRMGCLAVTLLRDICQANSPKMQRKDLSIALREKQPLTNFYTISKKAIKDLQAAAHGPYTESQMINLPLI